jgi:hypothetical protein
MRYLSWIIAFFLLQAIPIGVLPQAMAASPGTATNAKSEIHAVTKVDDGQAGYVHYFLITHPDGTLEEQVGIELEDQRIAWSFPGAGVIVSEFINNGILVVDGKKFFIEHLHGIRPFRTIAEMQTLRKELGSRVAYWIDNETTYCVMRQPGEAFCLNCGDFVALILFPGTTSGWAGLPEDYTQSLGDMTTTDDLLIYMLGLHELPDAQSRLQRLSRMNLPKSLFLDVAAMLQPDNAAVAAATRAATAPNGTPEKKSRSRLAVRKSQKKRL